LREYETVLVLDPTLDDARVNQELETVSNVISQGGGEILEVQRWGRRRLAYEVRRRREGIYSLIRFRSERAVLEELERRFSLNESLMRHLTVLSSGPMAPPSTEDHGERRHDRYEGRYGDRHGDRYGGDRLGRDHGDEDFEGKRRRTDDEVDGDRVALGDVDEDDKDERDDEE
jgi:small subunit ribosomal protein S6